MHNVVDRALRSLEAYPAYRAGHLSQAAFADAVLAAHDELVAKGLHSAEVHFATRLPADPARCAHAIADDLVAVGILDRVEVDEVALARAEMAARQFDHGDNSTYIYPEEALALHLITASLQPRRVAFCGSYYGYWAVWSLAALGHDCEVVLIDIDPAVCAVAEQNIKRLGYDGIARVVVGDAVEELPRLGPVDLVVIDAETPESEPDPQRRGKGIYTELLGASLGVMPPGAVVVFHNVVREHFNDDPFFAALVHRYEQEHGAMLAMADAELATFRTYPTTEGLAVGRSRS